MSSTGRTSRRTDRTRTDVPTGPRHVRDFRRRVSRPPPGESQRANPCFRQRQLKPGKSVRQIIRHSGRHFVRQNIRQNIRQIIRHSVRHSVISLIDKSLHLTDAGFHFPVISLLRHSQKSIKKETRNPVFLKVPGTAGGVESVRGFRSRTCVVEIKRGRGS